MTTPNGGDSKELTDMPQLSDVKATDALLDRLAARTPTDDDLNDPIIAELAFLAEFADASPVPSIGIERLIEVLGGRPLYMFDRGYTNVREEDAPIQLDGDRSLARMIDLSAPNPDSVSGDELDADEVAARVTGEPGEVASLARVRNLRLGRRPVTKTGWQAVLQQAALPAASVVALLAVGGGVSAVVTGDPMSPVYGVSRVASALPGIDNPEEKKIKSARRDIRIAQSAALNRDSRTANRYLSSAKNHLTDVPPSHKQELVKQMAQVQSNLNSVTGTEPATTAPAGPTPDVTASAPVDEPTPTVEPPETTPPSVTQDPTPAGTVSNEPSSGVQVSAEGPAAAAS